MMEPFSNKPLEEKELYSVTRSLAIVCYSLKLRNPMKYDFNQQGKIWIFDILTDFCNLLVR